MRTLALYERNAHVPAYLKSLVGAVVPVQTIGDITAAFDADLRKPMGKTIMEWDI